MRLYEAKKIDPSAWLKEAVLGQGAARLDAVCGAVATRFPQTHERIDAVRSAVATRFPVAHERLSSLSSTVRCPGQALEKAQEKAAEYYSSTISLPSATLRRVRTVGFDILDRTTEAILDRLLPLDACYEFDDDIEEEDLPRKQGCSVPQMLAPPEILRTFPVQLSKSAVLRVTVLCPLDACGAVVRRLKAPDVPNLLARAHFAQFRRQIASASDGASTVAALRARLPRLDVFATAPSLVGLDFATAPARARLIAARVLGTGAHAKEPAVSSDSPDAEEQKAVEPRCTDSKFRIVVKNSFIEVVEEVDSPPAPRVRSVSWSDFGTSTNCAIFEPFPVEISCAQLDDADQSTQDLSDVHIAFTPLVSGNDEGLDEEALESAASEDFRTTMQIRSIPAGCSRDMILDLLDQMGFAGRYNFVYLPIDFSSGRGLGYATVNLVTNYDAQELLTAFEGFRHCICPALCVCDVVWDERDGQKTLEELIERYRNSPVMHPTLPDGHRPVIFANGVRQKFPPPTKEIRRPRIRHARASEARKGNGAAQPLQLAVLV